MQVTFCGRFLSGYQVITSTSGLISCLRRFGPAARAVRGLHWGACEALGHNPANAEPALLQWVGWLSVLGFGLIFALLAVFLVWVDVKFSGVIYNSEQVCPEVAEARMFACAQCHAALHTCH